MADLFGGLGSLGGATLGRVLVSVGLDTTQLNAGLAKAEADSKAAGTNVSKFGLLAKAAFAVAAIAAVKFAVDAVKAAEAHQQILAQLQIAIGGTTTALEEQARATSQLTGFTDDQILSMDTVLSRFNLSKTSLGAVTTATLDYARATGQDAVTSAQLLGKASLGNARALKTLGIAFTATHKVAKDMATVVGLVESKVKGAAAAFSETLAGRIAKITAEFDHFKVELGTALIPFIEQAISDLQGLAHEVGNIIDLIPGMKPSADQAAQGLTGLQKAGALLAFGIHAALHPIDTLIHGFSIDIPVASDAAASGMDKAAAAAKALEYAQRTAAKAAMDQLHAEKALQQALPGLIGALLTLKNSQRALNRAQADSSTTAADLKQKELDVVNAFFALKTAGGDVIQKFKDGTKTLQDVVDKFNAQGRAAGLTKQQIKDLDGVLVPYLNHLLAIPSHINTSVTMSGVSTGGGFGHGNPVTGGGGGSTGGGHGNPGLRSFGGPTINIITPAEPAHVVAERLQHLIRSSR